MSGTFRSSIRKLKFSLWQMLLLFVGVGLLLTNALVAAPDATDEAKKGATKAGEKTDGTTKPDQDETEIQQAARTLVEGIKLAVIAGDERQQLDLLEHPVLRYGDIPRANVAVKEAGAAKFRYALARLGHAELHVEFDGKEVWRQERVAGTSPRDPYWLLFRGVSP
jgi:hypothetical protein